MEPRKDDDAAVELVDALLEEGAVLAADVLITVADVPLVGLKLRLLLAGMTEMTDRGVFEEWDREQRRRALASARDDTTGGDGDVVEEDGPEGRESGNGDRESGNADHENGNADREN